MTEEDVPNTTFLKWVVVILGIMIVGVAASIGIIVYKKAVGADEETIPVVQSPERPMVSPASAYGEIVVPLPEGMSVISTTEQGNQIYLTYGTDEADLQGIIVLNAVRGVVVGRFVFEN